VTAPGSGAGLRHGLVSAPLAQLLGIQNRAGCSCAGPYGHRLLGVKQGWGRVSLHYTFTVPLRVA